MSEEDFYWTVTPEIDSGADRECYVLYNDIPEPPPELIYSYNMTKYNVWNFTWESEPNFFGLLALKEGLKLFRRHRTLINIIPFNHTWDERDQIMRTRKFLPGYISKYTEEQLYYMTYVRVCTKKKIARLNA